MERWRLVDTGVLTAAENIAWDMAFLLAQAEGEPGPVLRFLQFSPCCVLVGRHQSPRQEARLDYVAQRGWHVGRRVTGGGAIFFDPSQLGWEVFATRKSVWAKVSPSKLYRVISQGAVEGLRRLGVDAHFRPRNDIEVGGRKLSGTGGASEGDAFLFQGTLLVRDVAEQMLRALRVPAEKLGRHGLESVRERVVFLEELLSPLPSIDEIKEAFVAGFSEVFGAEIIPSEPTRREAELFERLLPYVASDEWVYCVDEPAQLKGVLLGVSRGKGVVRVAAHIDISKRRITSVQFWGDFFIDPPRALCDLEALLKHTRAHPESTAKVIEDFFRKSRPHLIGLTPKNFSRALAMAIERTELVKQGFDFDEANSIFLVNLSPRDWFSFPFSHFLFPYCSKLVGCKYRHRHDCPVCGGCTVGEGYRLAMDAGLKPFTVTSFQSLLRTQRRLRKLGSKGYIGSCCEEFFVKHISSFERSGLGIVLIKLDSTTCYDLSQARAAYRGKFESQTELNIPLIQRVLSMLSRRPVGKSAGGGTRTHTPSSGNGF